MHSIRREDQASWTGDEKNLQYARIWFLYNLNTIVNIFNIISVDSRFSKRTTVY